MEHSPFLHFQLYFNQREDWVYSDSEKIVVSLIPVVNVQNGNPKKIHSLKDLTKDGVLVAIANPEMVCVGTYAVEIVKKNLTPAETQPMKVSLDVMLFRYFRCGSRSVWGRCTLSGCSPYPGCFLR